MKSIGSIGRGFVGGALVEGMKHAFRVVSYDVKSGLYDTVNGIVAPMKIEEGYQHVIDGTDGPIFICVPTPMRENLSCNTDLVRKVIRQLDDMVTEPRVAVIKSTCVPGTTHQINQECKNLIVCFNPEFLTERNAEEDFKNQDRIIVGGPHSGTKVLKQVYSMAYPDVPVTKTSSTIAEMVKYVTNGFLATKVAFANEIEQICGELEIDYDKVVEYATKDKRLGQSHWAIPGPDGKKGFGGSCFPKDINGLISLAESLNVKAHTLEGAWATNLEVRPERDWEQLKGRAVTS